MRTSAFLGIAGIISLAMLTPVNALTISERAIQTLDMRQSASLALRLTQRTLEQHLAVQLASYRPIPADVVNDMTDLSALRRQVISAQNAVQISRESIATMTDAQAASATAQVSAAIVGALQAPGPSAVTVSVPGSDSNKVVSVYSSTLQGLAKSVTPSTSGICKALSYTTSAYSAASPQFVSSAGSVGQKNTLSIAGFVLGIIPVAMQCSDDHATQKPAGQ